MASFARKELGEILRTWRIWVLPGIVIFFALTGPLLAKFTPQLVGAVAGSRLGGLKVPTPTYTDSYIQWTKNLTQIVLIAVIIVYGSLVSGEVRSGTAVLVLTKPLSRRAFVLVKAVVQSVFLAVVVAVGALITWLLTLAIFGAAPAGALWSATGVFLVQGLLFVALMTLLSSVIGSAAGSAGAGLAGFAVLAIAAIWKPLQDYSPAALSSLPGELAAAKPASVGWPVVTSLALALVLTGLAGQLFRRRDL
ncbi:MAG TPA: ABC transporter permease subunit [Candidatus Dormibacteraeota bacterium]